MRSPTLPSTNFMVFGSMPILPEQYTIPLHFMAWEKKGIGAGALGVRTDSLSVIFAVCLIFLMSEGESEGDVLILIGRESVK